jgi:hypothetical protein
MCAGDGEESGEDGLAPSRPSPLEPTAATLAAGRLGVVPAARFPGRS